MLGGSFGSVRTWRRTALVQPWTAVSHFRRRSHAAQDAMVLAAARQLFIEGVRRELWTSALAELEGSNLVPYRATPLGGTSHRVTLGRWLYALIRVVKPEVVVETGVSHGASSWLILNALHQNRRGFLHSIDLPDHDTSAVFNVGGSPKTGQAVPASLRYRWRLTIGDSTLELPRLLAEVGPVDVFFHDSDHSYEAMRREFDNVIPSLKAGGILVSDDVQKNRAFREACAAYNLRAYVFRKGASARMLRSG